MPDVGPPHQHRATRAIQRMVEFAPSTGGLALWVKHVDTDAGATAAPAVTDGATIYYSAAFEAHPLAEQAGIVAHEILHIALRHQQRLQDLRHLLGDVDLQLFTICADAIVNSTLQHLGWLELPPASVLLDILLQQALGTDQATDSALLQWDVESLYRAIDDRQPAETSGQQQQPAQSGQNRRQGGNGQDAQTQSGGQSDAPAKRANAGARQDGPRAAAARALGAQGHIDLIPGEGADTAPELEAERAQQWRDRLVRGHANDGAFSMLRALGADVPRSRTPWEHVLRTQLARGLAMKPALSWSRPTRSYIANQGRAANNRRMPWEPGFNATQLTPKLAIVVDVSGSIDADLMRRFSREIMAISRRQECSVTLIIGDDRVRTVEVFKPGKADLSTIRFEGGGGTDFTPLLAAADRYHPDVGVVLSDLDGPAHFQPRWPVIWAVPPQHAGNVAPFGRKLVLSV